MKKAERKDLKDQLRFNGHGSQLEDNKRNKSSEKIGGDRIMRRKQLDKKE